MHADIKQHSFEHTLVKYMSDKLNLPEASRTPSGTLTGYWGELNHDAAYFFAKADGSDPVSAVKYKENEHVAERQECADKYLKTDDDTKWCRYYFSIPLNTGLATSHHCLPPNIPIKISLPRTKPKRALLACVVDISNHSILKKWDESDQITIYNPQLNMWYMKSDEIERKMSSPKIEDFRWRFREPCIKTFQLLGGQSSFTFQLEINEPLPNTICLAMQDTDTLENGSFWKSGIKFTPNNLESIDITIGSQSLESFPLRVRKAVNYADSTGLHVRNNWGEAYRNYLSTTKQIDNPFNSGSITQKNYEDYNFITPVDLNAMGIKTGELSVHLKFIEPLTESKKLSLIYVAFFQKEMKMDSKFQMQIEHCQSNKCVDSSIYEKPKLKMGVKKRRGRKRARQY